jgi:hypothetical protein
MLKFHVYVYNRADYTGINYNFNFALTGPADGLILFKISAVFKNGILVEL